MRKDRHPRGGNGVSLNQGSPPAVHETQRIGRASYGWTTRLIYYLCDRAKTCLEVRAARIARLDGVSPDAQRRCRDFRYAIRRLRCTDLCAIVVEGDGGPIRDWTLRRSGSGGKRHWLAAA
jgi:hypothetical protein